MIRVIMLEGTGVPIEAECDDRGWNGFHVPTMHAEELQAYWWRCEVNDRNGEYDATMPYVLPDGRLVIPAVDADRDDLDHATIYRPDQDGRYSLSGLVWVDYDPNF